MTQTLEPPSHCREPRFWYPDQSFIEDEWQSQSSRAECGWESSKNVPITCHRMLRLLGEPNINYPLFQSVSGTWLILGNFCHLCPKTDFFFFFNILLGAVINLLLLLLLLPKVSYSLRRKIRPPSGREQELLELETDTERRRVWNNCARRSSSVITNHICSDVTFTSSLPTPDGEQGPLII